MDHARPAAPAYQALPFPSGAGFECVELWAADLGTLTEPVARCLDLLDADERTKAASFRFEIHRDRFILRRWLRRRILADRFDVEPRDIRFETDRLGWPRMVGPASLRGVGMSTSHAQGRALIGVRMGGDLGVDIARVDPALGGAEAKEFMSPGELRRWSELRETESAGVFFRLWTRKEACLKAAGTGLARDPRTVESWEPLVTAPLDRVRGWPDATWKTVELDLGASWAGSLAIPLPF